MENHTRSSGTTAHSEPPPPAADNPSPFLQLVINPDGTVTRPFFPTCPPNHDPSAAVVSADVTLDVERGTSLRIYVPRSTHANKKEKEEEEKLPTILFFHGGGFVMLSAASVSYHLFCERLAGELPAVVVSVDYRLAPEHRLPAAYEDATDALRWLLTQAAAERSRREPILRRADLSRCFLMGSSAGGNIVYRLGMEASVSKPDEAGHGLHNPNYVAGIIAHQPFFGGTSRLNSDIEGWNDPVVPLRVSDMMWELSLPLGATRDHEFAHPTALPTNKKQRLPRCLVTGSVEDPLIDWQRWFVDFLEANGEEVVARLNETGTHAAELHQPEAAALLIGHVKAFLAGK